MADTFRRVLRDKPFVVVDNSTMRNPGLSLKAKGLLVLCLSLPSDWSFSIRGLTGFCRDGKDAVESALQELERAGHLRRSKIPSHKEDGTFGGTEYVFFEVPDSADASPCPGKPDTVKPDTENPPQQKKDITKKDITKPPIAPQRGRRVKSVPKHEPEMFERFWSAYPRGEDRQGAVKEWDKLKPDMALMRTMSNALKTQAASDAWQRGIGIPYAVRWLRNRRWEDKIATPTCAIQQADRVASPGVETW